MPVSVVVGGQYGSEGKGKVAHWIAKNEGAALAVRVGGSNSGHTVVDEAGRQFAFRHLPTASILPEVVGVVGPGSYVDPDVLLSEIQSVGLSPDRLIIDPRAVLITEQHRAREQASGLVEGIGSTGSGTGAAIVSRISRSGDIQFAGTDSRLAPYVRCTRSLLRTVLDKGKRIIVEGTQGFGLSLLHSDFYPKVTSRDTTAAAFISEASLSPLDVDDVVMVIRTHPIRVAGDSGPLPNEISWGEVTRRSGASQPLTERTTVTRKVRRVAFFDGEVVKSAIAVNAPTRIALNHVDYIDSDCFGKAILSAKAQRFVMNVERELGANIHFVGTGAGELFRYRGTNHLSVAS